LLFWALDLFTADTKIIDYRQEATR
jgi:hypothetical protein